MSRHRTATTRAYGDVATRVLERRGHGPAVVLVHGFSDSAESWLGVLDALEGQQRHAVAVDLPGHGRAQRLERGPIVPQLVAFLTQVLHDHTIDGVPPVVVGNSLGGYVALRAAADAGTASGVVALAPAGFGSSRAMLHFARLAAVTGVRLERARVSPAMARWLAAHGASRLMVHDREGSRAVLAHHAAQFETHADVRRVLDMARRVSGELVYRKGEIPQVDVPVIVVWGGRDRLLPASLAPEVARLFPRGSFQVLTGVGHCVQIEAPHHVAEVARSLIHRHQQEDPHV